MDVTVTITADDLGLTGRVPARGYMDVSLYLPDYTADPVVTTKVYRHTLVDGAANIPVQSGDVLRFRPVQLDGVETFLFLIPAQATITYSELVAAHRVEADGVTPLPPGSTAADFLALTEAAAAEAVVSADLSSQFADDAEAEAFAAAQAAVDAGVAQVAAAAAAVQAPIDAAAAAQAVLASKADVSVQTTVETGRLSVSGLSNTIATFFPDRGERLASRLALRSGDITVGIAGDSTGNGADEHADLWAASVADDDETLRVEIPHWNDGTQAYSAATVVQEGEPQATGTVFLDLFERVEADLFGTTPDIGLVWSRDGANAAGDWSLDGTKAVRSADTTTGGMLADSGVEGDQTLTCSGVISTTARAVAAQARFYFNYVSPADHLYAQISVSTSGIVTMLLAKRINNVVTTLQSAGGGLITNTASQAFTVEAAKDGLEVTATINGVALSGALLQAESDALASSTKAGLTGAAYLAGDYLDQFEVALLGDPAPARQLTLFNASMSGSTLAYQQARLATMFPDPLDVLFISSSHNYGSQTPAQYWAALDAFVTAFRLVRPEAGIVIMSQNPQKPPATNRVAHLERLASLRSYAASRGYGYVPVVEAFVAEPDGGVTLINPDGIHPTIGASGSGSSLWRDTTIAYLAAISAA